MKAVHLGAVFAGLQILYQWTIGFGSNNNSDLCYPLISDSFNQAMEMPIAVNDTFTLAVGCNNYEVSGNLMVNDIFTPDSVWISQVTPPQTGYFTCDPTGKFTFVTNKDFRGAVDIDYRLSVIANKNSYTEARLTIYVEDDFDCDNIVNSIDIDDDNDGIIDFHEGDIWDDADGDGIANRYDIDSDNDGITDFTEWQTEESTIKLLLRDENCDGWDAAFDPQEGGEYYEQVDTDKDGTPDFLDTDSDDDGILDFIEAFDILNNRAPELKFSEIDHDGDGLDNSCDTINCEVSRFNPIGSNSPLPDHNNNGIRDWRETDQNAIEGEAQDAKNADMNLLAYPNPVINNCTVKIPNSEDFSAAPYSLKIYDMNGRLVHIELLYQHRSTLHLEHLLKGIYLLRVKTMGNIFSTRLIKSD